jgi:hypothetical protein
VLDELRDAALGDQGLALGERPSEERIVDGSQLRALCLELDAAGARGLSLSGAHVTGLLDLAATALDLALFFEDCTFDESILLVSTRVARLVLERCTVPALVASRLTVEAELELSQTTVSGHSSLILARLGGFSGDEAVLGSDAAGAALRLDGAQVEGDVNLTDAVATGGVSLRGARVGGAVTANRAHIDAGGEAACTLDRAEIGGDVFMSDGLRCAGGLHGLDTRIAGSLCLDDATFESPWAAVFDRASIGGDLTLRRLASRGRVSFDGAHVGRAVFCDGAVLESDAEYSLSFRRAEIGDMVYLGDGFQGDGPLLVSYARIGGDLNCVNATLKSRLEEDALTAVGTEIGGSVVLTNLNAVGKVFFMNSQIGGDFSAVDADIANLPEPAVDLVSVRVASNVVLDRLQSKGPVQIRGTRVGADVAVNDASLAAPGRPSALYIMETQIEGALTLSDVQADGIGVLASRAAILDDDLGGTGRELGSWTPDVGVLRLDGFRYDGFRRDVPVGARVRWLLATQNYEPRSWLQLASTLRAQGRDGDATHVLVEMQNDRLRRGGLSRPTWLGHQILRVTIGHGYRSWLAGVWAMVVIALFALVVWRAPGNFVADAGVDGAPQPVAYAADTFLPIVDLGEASRWLATGWVEWVEWGVILVGWALTTIFVAGFTRVVRSE